MQTFAHTETGFAQDVHQDEDIDAYKARFSDDIVSQWTVVAVPDGTEPGAKNNIDGTFSNPVPATPVTPDPVPLAINKDQFLALYAANGADLTAALANWPTG